MTSSRTNIMVKRVPARRDKFEAGNEHVKIGAMIHEARLEKGLTGRAC
jgi:hypothetical protein